MKFLPQCLLTLHNINFYQELMSENIRENIKKGTFEFQFHIIH